MSDDLTPKRLPQLAWRDPESIEASLHSVHDWAIARAQDAIDWYFKAKTPKAKWSRWLRLAAIVLATAGLIVPLVAAQLPELEAGWGYVVIALGGGCVAVDRLFGFSSAWMRYIVAATAIQARMSQFEVAWEEVSLKAGATRDRTEAVAALDLVRRFVVDVAREVERETIAWAEEFQSGVAELRELTTQGPRDAKPAADAPA